MKLSFAESIFHSLSIFSTRFVSLRASVYSSRFLYASFSSVMSVLIEMYSIIWLFSSIIGTTVAFTQYEDQSFVLFLTIHFQILLSCIVSHISLKIELGISGWRTILCGIQIISSFVYQDNLQNSSLASIIIHLISVFDMMFELSIAFVYSLRSFITMSL